MIEVQVGLTAAVVWGFAHAMQYSALRYNRFVATEPGYLICARIRFVAMITTALCFVTWAWVDMPARLHILWTMLRGACSI